MQAVKKFFADNTDATICYVAMGDVYSEKEAAELAVVATAAKVEVWSKDGMYVPDNAELVETIDNQAKTIKKLTGDLSDANETINSLGGPVAENKKIKELQKQLNAANETNAELQRQLAEKIQPVLIDHVVTEEDLVANPDLADTGVKVGDTIQIPEPKKDTNE